MANPLDFSGKRVLVTGGSNGIGNGVARAFRDAGAEVRITGTRDAGSYESDIAGMAFSQVDLADDDAIARLAREAGRLDVLVNNAGMVVYGRREFEAETFRKVVDVNLTATLTLSNLAKPGLTVSGGAIVNIASLTSFFASSGNPAYGASKAGIVQLTKTLAVAWARDGIRVNAIAPGWIETKMTEVSRQREAINEEILRRTPLARWGSPEDIAGVAMFLASPLAAYVTGETVSVDGGFSCAISSAAECAVRTAPCRFRSRRRSS